MYEILYAKLYITKTKILNGQFSLYLFIQLTCKCQEKYFVSNYISRTQLSVAKWWQHIYGKNKELNNNEKKREETLHHKRPMCKITALLMICTFPVSFILYAFRRKKKCYHKCYAQTVLLSSKSGCEWKTNVEKI